MDEWTNGRKTAIASCLAMTVDAYFKVFIVNAMIILLN